MKKIILLLIVFSIQLICKENFATSSKDFDIVATVKSEPPSFIESPNVDAWYKHRSKCRWWKKKYKTLAQIKKNGSNWSKDYDKGCVWAKSYIYDQDVCNDYRVIAASAKAQAGDNIQNFSEEYVNIDCDWSAGVEVDYQTPKYSLLPMLTVLDDITESSKFSGAKISNTDVLFRSEDILIEDFSLFLSANSKDFANYYSVGMITVEEALDDEGNHSVQGKVYWSAKAFIYNGELILEGGFETMENLKVNCIGKGSYEVSIDQITINLSEMTSEIDINDLEVGFYVDNGNLGIGIPDIYSLDFTNNAQVADINNQLLNEANVNFSVYPNPSRTYFELDYNAKVEDYYKIHLTDLQGELVKVLSENEILIPHQKKRFDISDISKGVYLIQLVSESKIYSRKLIIQ